MSLLESLDKEELELLVPLPYRTGLWVSLSDESGGDTADEAELQALESIVCGFSEDFCKSELAEAILNETVLQREQWDAWSKTIENVPSECRQAVEVLAKKYDHKNVTGFKETLMEISYAVALAYREFDNSVPLKEKVTMYWAFVSDRVLSKVLQKPPKTHDEIFNISRAEKLALTELSVSLKPEELEGLEVIDIYADENIDPNIGKKVRFEDTEVEL
jgi:hypothetical protein